MTEEQFLKFYSGYFGETIDNINQITHHAFTGQELFEFVSSYTEDKVKELEAQNKHYETRDTNLLIQIKDLDEEISALKGKGKEPAIAFADWIKFNARYCAPDGWKDEDGLGETRTTTELFNLYLDEINEKTPQG